MRVIGKVEKVDDNYIQVRILTGIVPDYESIVYIRCNPNMRTTNQNSLYWLFCTYVGDALGLSPDEVHEGFKINILGSGKMINGIFFKFNKSTKALTRDEFIEYFERCNELAIELGVDTAPFWRQYEKIKEYVWEVRETETNFKNRC